jgi:hypothetical protein
MTLFGKSFREVNGENKVQNSKSVNYLKGGDN